MALTQVEHKPVKGYGKSNTSRRELERAVEVAREIRSRQRFNKLDFYDPYPYQEAFHTTGADANQRLLMAANRIGKSYCGAAEIAFHTTGLYPKWWKGRRFNEPVVTWCGGVSNETTRDIVQFELLGPPDNPEAWGLVLFLKKLIVNTERKPGIPNAKKLCPNKARYRRPEYHCIQVLRDGPREVAGQVC